MYLWHKKCSIGKSDFLFPASTWWPRAASKRSLKDKKKHVYNLDHQLNLLQKFWQIMKSMHFLKSEEARCGLSIFTTANSELKLNWLVKNLFELTKVKLHYLIIQENSAACVYEILFFMRFDVIQRKILFITGTLCIALSW